MNIKQQIKNYIPYNDQEKKDQEMILKYMNQFDNLLTRDNEIVHFTSSGFVLNKTRDKVLMVYHNIYHSWAWTGGHNDGETDFLKVAIKEAQEETGVYGVKPLTTDIFSLDTLSVMGHYKKESYVSSHIHINITYLLEADEQEKLKIKEDENSNVAWIALDTFMIFISEEHMKTIYAKIIKKAKELGYIGSSDSISM